MKISLLIDSMRSGGKERQLFYLCKSFPINYSIQVIIFDENIFYKEIYDLPVELVVLKRNERYSIKTFCYIFNKLNQFRPDILQCYDNISQLISLPYIILYKINVINFSIQYAGKITRNMKGKLVQKIAFATSHIILSVSKAGLIVENQFSSTKGRYIHCGFDYSGFPKNQAIIPEDIRNMIKGFQHSVVMVARFSSAKDYRTFINSAKIVVKENPEIGFFCIGDGPARKSMEIEAGILLNNNIFFLGTRNDVHQLLHAFDIGILLTNTNGHAEGISNVIMEYMAAVLPVIATNAGGTPELVRDQESGFLVLQFNPEVVAEKILFLLKNDEVRKEMGQKGREIIKNEFSLEKMTCSFINLYKSLLNEKKTKKETLLRRLNPDG